jgi:hypothetical protein
LFEFVDLQREEKRSELLLMKAKKALAFQSEQFEANVSLHAVTNGAGDERTLADLPRRPAG